MPQYKVTNKISELQNNFSSDQIKSSTIFQTLKSLKLSTNFAGFNHPLCTPRPDVTNEPAIAPTDQILRRWLGWRHNNGCKWAMTEDKGLQANK